MPTTTKFAAFNLREKSSGNLYSICLCGCNEPNNPPGATLFTSAAEATEFIKFLANPDRPAQYKKYAPLDGYHPVVHVDDTWKRREMDRFKSGQYHLPVWYDEKWFQDAKVRVFDKHFPHVAMSDPEVIAFTDSPEKGMQDVQTKIKPGKFLQRFFGDVLTADQITEWSAKHTEEWSKGPELKFAKTPEEFEQVYMMDAGFTSCMQKPITTFQTLINPTRVYGAGDLQLAYIMDKKGTKLLARALCWPEKKKVGRVYGDVARLRAAVKNTLGFETTSDNNRYDTFEGAKLLKIEYEGGYIVPYIDASGTSINYVEDIGDFLKITNGKGKQAGNQHGYIGSGKTCKKCGNAINGRYYKVHTENSNFGIAQRWCSACTQHYGKSITHEEGRYYVDPRRIPVISIAVYEAGQYKPVAVQYTIAHFVDTKAYVTDMFDHYLIKKDEAISLNLSDFIHKNKIAQFVAEGVVFRSDFDGKYYSPTTEDYRAVKVGSQTWTRAQAMQHAKFDPFKLVYNDGRSQENNLFNEPLF